MKKYKNIIGVMLMLMIIASCNKTKKYSKRLAGETWTVTELTVNGTAEEELPKLIFSDCDIYDELCKGEWESHEGEHAEYVWQIREKGKTFELSNQSTLEDAHSHSGDEHAIEEVITQCQNFSGVYTITESKRKSMQMESSSTVGYDGKKVVMKLELK